MARKVMSDAVIAILEAERMLRGKGVRTTTYLHGYA
jgi:hypothetical protein